MFRFQPKMRLNVQTKSGASLGRVYGVDVDEQTGRIARFIVISAHVIPRLFDHELIITWDQVVDWRKDTLIVADAAVPLKARNIVLASSPETGAHFSDTSA